MTFKLLAIRSNREVTITNVNPSWSIIPNNKKILQPEQEKLFFLFIPFYSYHLIIHIKNGTGQRFIEETFENPIFCGCLSILLLLFSVKYCYSSLKISFTSPCENKDEETPNWKDRIPYDMITYKKLNIETDPKFIIIFREHKETDIINKLKHGLYDFISFSTYNKFSRKIHPITQEPLIKNINMFIIINKDNDNFELVEFNI